jgi:hypothetical protein
LIALLRFTRPEAILAGPHIVVSVPMLRHEKTAAYRHGTGRTTFTRRDIGEVAGDSQSYRIPVSAYATRFKSLQIVAHRPNGISRIIFSDVWSTIERQCKGQAYMTPLGSSPSLCTAGSLSGHEAFALLAPAKEINIDPYLVVAKLRPQCLNNVQRANSID